MATQYSGMFGPSPEELQQIQRQQDAAAAMNYGRMNQDERNSSAMYRAGGMLAGAALEGLGYENTAQAKAKKIQGVIGQIDTETSAGMLEAARKFNEAGLSNEAQIAFQKANELKKQESETKLRDAQAQRAMREPTQRGYEIENLVTKLDEYEPDSPEYKAIEARIKMLTTRDPSKGGAGRTGTSQYKTGDDGIVYEMLKDGSGKSVMVTKPDGTPLMAAEASPALKSALAQASGGGKVVGTGSGEAQLALPKIENDIATIKNLSTRMFNHPGFKELVGAGTPGLRFLQGSSVPGAKAFVDQINGIAYLMARQELKGQGQVTENEANAAQAAFTRMNTATSERDFMEAYDDFIKRVENVREMLRKQSSMTYKQGGGYAGGSKGAADSGRLEILNQELKNPALSRSDKDALNREIARTQGINPQVKIDRASQFKVLR